MLDFGGRLVVVTGGTGALGSVVTGALLDAGARVRVPVFDSSEMGNFEYRNRVELMEGCDLTKEPDVARIYKGTKDLWASIHIAGGFSMCPLMDTDKATLMRMIEVNYVSAYLCSRAAARVFGNDGGRIVNVAARAALEPRMGSGMSAYAASKAAVVALTIAAGEELKHSGILVNAVAPSIIDTPANRTAMPSANHRSWPSANHCSWPSAKDIAAAILFLASSANCVTTGAIVPVYGRS
ncbi:SDR family oxidoreductase [Variovorax sp. J31P207]|uniref:SDR family oxidoreductase n=1 Tax=Variovorax sp. J31P207 TaxID=3053510 RepID=UPI002575DCE0|nr:SDR family oxidoreductase [Variovorax sp. J31P207]MDM0069998.1 SDR family oxidoreductase [Variovorax sp. J31P207]